MKTMMKGLLVTALVVVGGFVMSAGNAQCADEPLPPEVKKLIGMRIPAKAGDVVPGWKVMGAGIFGVKTGAGQELGYELLYQQDISILVTDELDSDHSRTIIDARILPRQLLTYKVEGGKAVRKKNANRMYFVEHGCKSENYEAVVVGLVRSENSKIGCEHWSSQVKRAWSIDVDSGRISEISPRGVSCLIQSESICQ
ncbi:MAG: hypothetical protein KKF58_05800 [Gammaproteobacteria bacterium]|nr:hypothetical protein [Gammaproteobacteria bacterium]MBU1447807.1 hypothetical protein [Gammaproteobacteria bacterium]